MSLLHTTRSIYVKHKVLLGFLLTMAVLSGAAYLTFQSYQRILNTLRGTAKPQQELSLISQILLNISQVEASNYAYRATSQEEFLEELALQARELQEKMEVLRAIAPWDSLHRQKIDSIEFLLQDFPENVRSLIALRRELGKGDNLREVQKMIRKQLANPSDTSLLSSDTLRNILVQEITKEQKPLPAPYEPEKSLSEEKKADKKNRGLLGRKSAKEEKKEEVFVIDQLYTPVIKDYSVIIDTIAISNRQAALLQLDQDLEKLHQKAAQMARRLESKELAFVQRNTRILENVREIIIRFEKEAAQKVQEQEQKAIEITENSSWQIGAILVAGILGALLFIYLIFSDLTRNDAYRSQLLAAKREAERLAQAKETFLANMSHEIRTPLHSIIGYAEQLLRSGQLRQAEAKNATEAIYHSSEHLLALVNDVLDLSKLEANAFQLEVENFSLQELLKSSYETFKAGAEGKGLAFAWRCEPEAVLWLQGDAFRLRQVLFNLLSNAIKFTEEGRIELLCRYQAKGEGYAIEIAVKDTGIGIAMEKQAHLFQNFYQGEAHVARKYGGTGLGLAIAKKIVQAMGGDLRLRSKSGQGATFTVYLQMPQGEAQIQSPLVPGLALGKHLEGLKVLVVEDDPLNAKLAKMLLEKHKAEVFLALHGREALQVLEKQSFDWVLLDLQMPEMSGWEVLEAMKARNIQVPVLVSSANILPQDTERMKKYGLEDHLPKPYKEEALLEKLGALPRKPSASYNLAYLQQFTGGDEALEREILLEFLQESQQSLEALQAQISEADWPEVAAVVHRLYSRCSQLGAQKVAENCKNLEIQIRKELINAESQNLLENICVLLAQLLQDLQRDFRLKSTDSVG